MQKKLLLFILLSLSFVSIAPAQKVGLTIQYIETKRIPPEIQKMTDLSKKQIAIRQLSKYHKPYTLYAFGDEAVFSTMGISSNAITLQGNGSVYTNSKTHQSISIQNIIDKSFVVKSDSMRNQWEIFSQDTMQILGKRCMKAVYKKNKNVIAWFCDEVPFAVGPDGFLGLPGAILKLTTYISVYEATGMGIVKDKVTINLPKGKYMKEADFYALRKKKMAELKAANGGSNVIVLKI
ncbi:MAG: GLPGLI family protein [Prevotella sp.]|jgi:GLPGLI family protein|nr:GLPGLI family protein [Prevotella sp.]MCH3993190.1 GLPGLI family protein [Prevotella sp.]MCI1474922.1 GLPGLI family protein [Prevotella sp.]MCI1550102.1 GLPGLI family protein [Prevotella sp.]MCI1597059.1 GLPGLI family protein [Prevotella sp.]